MCTANLIVTNHEAQNFPGCRLNRNYERIELDHNIGQLLFDRVLCDVPCSGDGTLRKAPDLWRKWQFLFLSLDSSSTLFSFQSPNYFLQFILPFCRNTGMGHGLHSLQVLIAMRGAFQFFSLIFCWCLQSLLVHFCFLIMCSHHSHFTFSARKLLITKRGCLTLTIFSKTLDLGIIVFL